MRNGQVTIPVCWWQQMNCNSRLIAETTFHKFLSQHKYACKWYQTLQTYKSVSLTSRLPFITSKLLIVANGHFQSPVPTFGTNCHWTLLLHRHSLSSDSVWRLSCSSAHTRTYWFNMFFSHFPYVTSDIVHVFVVLAVTLLLTQGGHKVGEKMLWVFQAFPEP